MSRCANMFLEATAKAKRRVATALSFVEEEQIWAGPITASDNLETKRAEQQMHEYMAQTRHGLWDILG